MSDNCIKQVRPNSTFNNFILDQATSTQRLAHDTFKKLANRLANHPPLLEYQYPFDNAQLFVLAGPPGTGKTHLIEALINEVTTENPELIDRIFLYRGVRLLIYLTHDFIYKRYPIVIVDDLLFGYNSLNDVDHSAISELMEAIQIIYECRNLVIFTSNFPVLSGGLYNLIE